MVDVSRGRVVRNVRIVRAPGGYHYSPPPGGAGLVSAEGTLFGLGRDYAGGIRLVTIDATTGEAVPVGPLGVDGRGCAMTALHDTVYLIVEGSLYTVHLTTGAATLVAPIRPGQPPGTRLAAMAAHNDTLYALLETDKEVSLYRLDPISAVATKIGPSVYAAPGAAAGMASFSGALYAVVCPYRGGPTRLCRVDPSTGNAIVVSTDIGSDYRSVNALALAAHAPADLTGGVGLGGGVLAWRVDDHTLRVRRFPRSHPRPRLIQIVGYT